MAETFNKPETIHCQKLVALFKGQLSTSDRSYYANLFRLEDFIDNFKDETCDNGLILGPKNRRAFYESRLQKLKGTVIVYDHKILEQKLEKYNEKKSSFPEFSNAILNQFLNEVPSKPVREILQEDLAKHSLVTQGQTAFFKYWMNLQKEELEAWLESLIEKEAAGAESDPRSTKEGLTLTQWILVGSLDGTLTAAEDFYGIHLAKHLSELWGRPQNKIAAVLKKFNDPSHEWMKTAAYRKDMKAAQDHAARYRDDR